MKTEVVLSDHAVLRFQERVRPTLTLKQARRELARLIDLAEYQEDPPAWHNGEREDFHGAALLTPDIYLPLRRNGNRFYAVSCITRSGLSPGAREHRHKKRRAKRYRRMMARKKWKSDRRETA